MSTTNIRLFVPNTTEALDFEYGLLIHYMSYNEYRAQSEVGLQYYELAEIDPIDNALDIVQHKVITDAARSQSKIDGFTLDSHYTLSFGERLNNKIAEDSVRQVWLWLHCKNTMEYPFLLEKVTDTDQKIVSEQNQLLVRLWVHPEWQEREIDPLAQAKINSRLELISVMKQALSAQFDQIEQANRQKVLAELKLKVAKPLVEKLIASAEKKISPPVCIDSDDLEILQQAFLEWRLNNRTRKLHDFLPSSFLEKINQLGYEIVFAQAGVGLERMIIDRKPPRDTLMVGLSSASHSLMYCYYKTYQGDERWTPNTWYEVSIDSPDAADEQTVHQLEELGQIDEVHLKTISTPPPTVLPNLVSAAPQAEYKPKPIIQKSTDNIQSSIKYAVLLAEMQKKTYTIDQAELRINVIKSEVEKIKQNMNTIDDDFIDISSACVKHVQDCIRKIISEREVFYANRVDKHVFIFLMNKSLVLLEQLMRLDMYDEVRKDLAQSITEIQHTQKAYVSNTVVESQTPMLISGEQPVDKKQESVIPWWIWPVAIFIGFVIDIRLGIGLCVAAILWGIFKVFMIFPAFFGFVIFFGFLWIVFSA